jgi:Ca-activated chloride channel family protein
MISERRRSAAAAALIAVLLVPAAPAAADSAGDAVKLYKKGDYLGALAKFREALEESPSATLYYDVGNSLYRLEKFDEAARHYLGSVSEADSSLEMRARYNAGNTLLRRGKTEGAIDQYIKALKLNPDDEDAKHNLEIALRKLQESRDNPQGQEGGEQDDREGEEPQGEREDSEGRGESEPGEDGSEPEGGESGEGRSEAEDGMDRPPSPVEEDAGRFTAEEAERLLEALASDERDLLIERLKSRVRRKGVKKDW